MKPRVPTIKSARVFAALPSGVLGAALVVRLFDEWWSYLPAGIVDDLHRDLHVDYAAAGWLLTLLWVGGFAGNGIGIVADHLSRRATAVTGALLLAAGLSVFALGAPYAGLALASVVMGAASDLIIRPIEAAIADEHGERLDRVLGWQHTLSWIGDLIGPLLLGLGAATSIGWRGAFAITAIAMALFAAHLATVRFPAPAAPAETRHSALADIVAIARRRDVLQIAAAELLLSPLDEPFLAFVVARAAAGSAAVGSRAAAQVLAAGVVVGGLAGSATVARRGLTSAVRRSGPTILFGGASLTPVTRSLVVQAAAMVLVGAGTACTWAAIHHRMLTIVPGRAATVSSVVGLLDTPALLVPVVVGVIADRAGLTAALTIYVALAGALVLLTATRRNERKRRRKAPGDRTARRLTRNGGDTGRVTAFDSSALDDAYIAFPPLELWRAARVNEALWFDTLQRLREAQSAVPPAAVADERDRSLRAAALNTGALEGLHNADRGLTFTVVNEAAWRETIDRVEGADARRFVEAAIDAFDLVLDVATGTHPLSEALIRELHSAVTAPQQTYVAQTQLGPQDLALPKGEYKKLPNHVREPNGTWHSYAPLDRVTEEMHRLVTELDSHLAGTVHPAVQAAFAHHALVAIHPFVDGNGRVARLLGSVFLLRDASIPLMIWADQSAEYRAALKEADAGRPQAFVDFVFDRAIDTMNLMNDRLRTRAAEGRMALRQEQERNQVAAAERLLEMVGRAVQRVVERGRDGFALTAETVEVIYVGRPMDLVHGSAQQLVATRGGAKAGCDFVIVICRDEVVSVAVDASAFRERRTFRVAELVPELRSSAAQQIEDFVVRACTEFLADLAS